MRETWEHLRGLGRFVDTAKRGHHGAGDPGGRTLAASMRETLAERLKMTHELGKKLAQS